MTHPSIHARTQPDKIAYQMAGTGKAITYRELDELSNQGAQLFRSLGLKAGDHIAFLIENRLAFMEICWAAQRCGLYYTAISRYLTQDEIAYIVKDCGAKRRHHLAEMRRADQGAGHRRARRAAVLHARRAAARLPLLGQGSRRRSRPRRSRTRSPATTCCIRRAPPAGPRASSANPKHNPIDLPNPFLKILCADMCGMNADSIYLSPAPLYHAAPLRFNMMAITLGGTSIIMESFDAEEFLKLVEKYKITQSQLVPTMFVRMLKLPDEVRAALRRLLAEGRDPRRRALPDRRQGEDDRVVGTDPDRVLRRLRRQRRHGVDLAAMADPSRHRRPRRGRQDQDSGRERRRKCRSAQIGTVYFADAPVFTYHNDPEKTKRAYNAKGWSTLGDVGYLDDEGFLYLTDRKSYMIISGGVNIYPQETEDVLITHPDVADVAVFGVPNEEMGEEVKAVVQPHDMAKAGKELEAELIVFCRKHLSPIKCPKSIDFEAELPRTPTGKLVKRHLRDNYWPKTAVKV